MRFVVLLLAFLTPCHARAADFVITQDQLQAVIDYLATRPYKEVFQIVPPLLTLQPVPPPPKVEEKK